LNLEKSVESQMMEFVMKKSIAVLAMLTSGAALAHSGHGETSLFSHDLEHMLWYVSGLALVAVVCFAWRKSQ
jgi:hypothetical protein